MSGVGINVFEIIACHGLFSCNVFCVSLCSIVWGPKVIIFKRLKVIFITFVLLYS